MTSDMLFMLGVVELINLAILFIIIQSATKANLRAKYEYAQMELLARIATAQGVPAKELEKIFITAGLRK